jgi:hypothetical protein
MSGEITIIKYNIILSGEITIIKYNIICFNSMWFIRKKSYTQWNDDDMC